MENGIRRAVLRSLFMLHRKDVLGVVSRQAVVEPGCYYLVRNPEKTLQVLCGGGRGGQVFGASRVAAEASPCASSLCPGRRQGWHKVTAEEHQEDIVPFNSLTAPTAGTVGSQESPLLHVPKNPQCSIPEDPWAPGSYWQHDGKLNNTQNHRTEKHYPYYWYYSGLHFILLKIPMGINFTILPTVSTVQVMQFCSWKSFHDSGRWSPPCLLA